MPTLYIINRLCAFSGCTYPFTFPITNTLVKYFYRNGYSSIMGTAANTVQNVETSTMTATRILLPEKPLFIFMMPFVPRRSALPMRRSYRSLIGMDWGRNLVLYLCVSRRPHHEPQHVSAAHRKPPASVDGCPIPALRFSPLGL